MKPEERDWFKDEDGKGTDATDLDGNTAPDGRAALPEVQRFSGFYHVQTEELPHDSLVKLDAILNRDDFDAVFTGNFELCGNEQVRGLSEKGAFFSAKVLSDSIGFLRPASRGQVVRVYFLPVAKVEYDRDPGPQELARKARTRILRQKGEAAPQPAQVRVESVSVVVHPIIDVKNEARTADTLPPALKHTQVLHPRTSARRYSRNTRRQEPDDPQDDDEIFTRRAFMVATGLGLGSLLFLYRKQVATKLAGFFTEYAAKVDLEGPGTAAESNEKLRTKPLEVLFEASRRMFLPDSKTWRDNILKRDAVSQYFLGGKFRAMDVETDFYNGVKQNFYHFAVIGEKSGQIEAKKGSEKQYLTTTLADAVNILLETGSIDHDAVEAWIVWVYKRSFGVSLDSQRLRLKWKNKSQLESVAYFPENGFVPTAGIEVVEKMEAGEEQPGGNMSKKREPQDLLGQGNSLMLPTGVSPQHDLVVPQSLMKSNPSFSMKFANTWQWDGVSAQDVSDRIRSFEERVKASGDRKKFAPAFGRTVVYESIAPLIERNDPMIRQLAQTLLKDIPAQNHQARITALYRFVQSLPYRTEYDTDVDRPSFITLFNGGGDCNNLTILFNELMLAAGYDTAILFVAFNKNRYELHTRGGIPAKYFPGARHWTNGTKKWVPIELAGKQIFHPGMEAWGSDETTYSIEELES